ncbi:MAG TPA: membrane protein insertase YidC [Thermoanaerobaculia bacterium]|nr:membrane protein insertase YidC [Thermoanaerobaculia bacterium]
MEKRVFVAVLLSFGFLFFWAAALPRLFPSLVKEKPKAPVTARATTPRQTIPATSSEASASPAAAANIPAVSVATVPPESAESAREIVVDTPLYVARLSNRGAQLVSFALKNYGEKGGAAVELVRVRPAGNSDYPFSVEANDQAAARQLNEALYTSTDVQSGARRTIEFRYVGANGLGLTKTFVFNGEYQFDFAVEMLGRTIPFRVMMGPGIKTLRADEEESRFVITGNGLWQQQGSLKVFTREKTPELQVSEGKPDYVGVEDNYFLAVFKAVKASSGVIRSNTDTKKAKQVYAGLSSEGPIVSGQAYFGPKEATLLERYGLEKALQFGVFSFFARILLWALIKIYGVVGNYGWAIIVLTVIIKLLLYPLQHKSIVSMKKMQKLQPKVNALRDKYKKAKSDAEQRQKLNTEMMKLYQVEGVSPMGGCLPLLMQLPILWAFYGLLSHAIELRGAPFVGWIHDLSAKDPTFLLPILMTITTFIQQKMMPATGDAAQRRMFMFMPLVLGFIFKDFPSGLVLYWLVQNILTIAQQAIMNKYWDHDGTDRGGKHPLALGETQGAR